MARPTAAVPQSCSLTFNVVSFSRKQAKIVDRALTHWQTARLLTDAQRDQLRAVLGQYDYQVELVEVTGCLHLKSACSYIGNDTVLVNRSWIAAERLRRFELLDVPEEEPAAANALLLNGVVVIPASFHKTRALLEERGFCVRTLDVSELQKAEAGVTCTSLIFSVPVPVP